MWTPDPRYWIQDSNFEHSGFRIPGVCFPRFHISSPGFQIPKSRITDSTSKYFDWVPESGLPHMGSWEKQFNSFYKTVLQKRNDEDSLKH